MHFVDEGDGEPVLFLHGDPTWGYLWRNIVAPLSRKYRCLVPDQMGMGKSGNPREPSPYRLRHHAANLEGLLLGLDLWNLTLVLHDWGGPVGLTFAARHRNRVKRLVLMNTWAFAKWPGGPLPRLVNIIRSAKGERFVLEKNAYLEPALKGTTYKSTSLTQTVLAAYHAPFPTPDSRRAMLYWSRDIPLEEGDASFADMKSVETALADLANTPTLFIWGMRDPVLPASVLEMWKTKFPNAPTVRIADASHFLQEDAPNEVATSIADFLEATAPK